MIEYFKKLFNKNKTDGNTPKTAEDRINEMYGELSADIVSIKLGNDIGAFYDNLGLELAEFRENLFEKTGFIFPPIRVTEQPDLQENEFTICVRNKEVKNGFCHLTEDDALNDIIKALEDVYKENIDKIFSNEIMEKYMDTVQKQNGWMVWNLSNAMPLWGIRLVLVNLLKEGKSIKDINYIFDKICIYATKNRDVCIKADPYMISDKMSREKL
ncbi:MAG: FHIPEP family type III secretion protein [Candidatus Gastranaerophilales bacterium]|nr:FHIPEP family type III secretion protein [Candidatus Gastranaerophilales bacterium]